MYNNLLKTKKDGFQYLTDVKYQLLHKAQEAEDLGNTEIAEMIRSVAKEADKFTKQLAQEV